MQGGDKRVGKVHGTSFDKGIFGVSVNTSHKKQVTDRLYGYIHKII